MPRHMINYSMIGVQLSSLQVLLPLQFLSRQPYLLKSTQFWIEKSLPHSINGIANWIESADIAQPVGKKGYSGESS